MKAAVIKKPGLIVVEEVSTPKPADGEVLLKVEACALCGTDQRVLKGEKHHKFGLDDFNRAVEVQGNPSSGAMKVVINFTEENL